MTKKSKLFFSLVSLCFSFAVLCFGVYSAVSVDYSVMGSVSYELTDVFVDIETTLYMSQDDLAIAKSNMQTNLESLETSLKNNTTIPSNMFKTSYTDSHSTYNNGQVDVSDTISFDNLDNPLNINYGEYVEAQSAYSYFVVIKITNYAENAIGAQIDLTVEDLNTLVMENSLSKNISGVTQDPTIDYFVICMTLDDPTADASGSFDIDVTITKETVSVATLSVNNLDGTNVIDTLEGIGYTSKSINIQQPTIFMPYEGSTAFAYNLELSGIPENVTSFNFDFILNGFDYSTAMFTTAGIIEGNYSDPYSLLAIGQPALEGNGNLLGFVQDFSHLGNGSTALGMDVTPYYHRAYGMYIGQHTGNMEICLIGILSSIELDTFPAIDFSISFTDSIDEEIFVERDDGTYAYGVNALLTYNSEYFESQGSVVDFVVPQTHNGKSVSRVYYAMSYGLTTVESFTFHDGITTLEPWTFSHCSSLSNVTLPNNITVIPMGMFDSCTNLKSVIIPDGVISIREEAFLNMGLESITIPSSVQNIAWTFAGCTSLDTVYIDSATIAAGIDDVNSSTLTENLQSGTGKLYILSTIPESSVGDYITNTANFTKGGNVVHDGKTYVEYTKV